MPINFINLVSRFKDVKKMNKQQAEKIVKMKNSLRYTKQQIWIKGDDE